MRKKLIPLDTVPGSENRYYIKPRFRLRIKCWLRHHDLQLTASTFSSSVHWRCRRCTRRFAKKKGT